MHRYCQRSSPAVCSVTDTPVARDARAPGAGKVLMFLSIPILCNTAMQPIVNRGEARLHSWPVVRRQDCSGTGETRAQEQGLRNPRTAYARALLKARCWRAIGPSVWRRKTRARPGMRAMAQGPSTWTQERAALPRNTATT